ncbi:MAG TPA: NAD(P)-dependent oxidoreductase [Rectinemataceae bacterium]|nr:NAD(P)-dependent oxidoreductase [Rectinemataceae bacterium]
MKPFKSEAELEAFMSAPSANVVGLMREIEGDIAILGIAGKVGMTLGMMAVRAIATAGVNKKVYGVSRFSDAGSRSKLDALGIETIACDLLDVASVRKLPIARNVIFLAGKKFGTVGAQDLTWATNTIAPANVAEHFASSSIVAFSTGCVYDFVPSFSGGSVETDDPKPVGEYAQSTLGRERVFEHYSRTSGTPVCLFRLNYAIDVRYGVLYDIASKVYGGEPIDLSVGTFNCIWQGDVLERALLSLKYCTSPPTVLNITGPETVSVRWTAGEFGRCFGRKPLFTGAEPCGAGGYLANAAKSIGLFGYPSVTLPDMIDMVAAWVTAGGPSLGKPTHFESTDGRY